jgi:toxin HigB-1
MIESFRHKGLRQFLEEDDSRKLPPQMAERIREILTALDSAGTLDELNLPSFRLHPLKGDLKGFLGGHGASELAYHLSF